VAEPNYELVGNNDIHLASKKPSKKGIKNIVSGILRAIFWIYLFSVSLVFLPYYNWQFAKANGFVKWLVFGEIVPTAKAIAWPYFELFSNRTSALQSTGIVSVLEYIDNEYGFVFQYPSDWKVVAPMLKDESSEARVAFNTPKSNSIIVSVEKLYRPTISRAEFENNPNRDVFLDTLINLTIESVYKKTSRDIGASRMIIDDKYFIPSNIAIKFFVNTLHFIRTEAGEQPMILSAIHCFPFDKDYSIRYMMLFTADAEDKAENETLTNVINSFHLVGEKPLKNL